MKSKKVLLVIIMIKLEQKLMPQRMNKSFQDKIKVIGKTALNFIGQYEECDWNDDNKQSFIEEMEGPGKLLNERIDMEGELFELYLPKSAYDVAVWNNPGVCLVFPGIWPILTKKSWLLNAFQMLTLILPRITHENVLICPYASCSSFLKLLEVLNSSIKDGAGILPVICTAKEYPQIS